MGTFAVFNLEVEDAHSYLVGERQVWVHNNCFEKAVFASAKALDGHFVKHGGEWAGQAVSKSGYLNKARALLGSKPSSTVLGHVRKNGDLMRYNTVTNEFAVAAKDGTIRTLFRPKKGLKYWAEQIK